jgi:hypothetical protein
MHRTLVVSIALSLLPVIALAQLEGGISEPGIDATSSDWVMPRTEYGHPDLQGTWLFGSTTPFQRRMDLGLKQTYSEAEAVELERMMQARLERADLPLDPNRDAPEAGARIGQEADDTFLAHWRKPELVKINGEYRTSVIVDPPNGRLPKREGFKDFTAVRNASGLADTDGPEGQPLSGRCIMFGAAVPSLTPIMMNPNLMIVQTEAYVMIMTEMINDARIIRLDAEHFDNGVRNWMGDSIGKWEDDTLVVRSKNFRPEQSSGRSVTLSEDFELEERYTIVGDNEILYAFTFVDPQAYTQPVSGERILSRNAPDDRIYEFACHEGNYSLAGILAGARRLDSAEDGQ